MNKKIVHFLKFIPVSLFLFCFTIQINALELNDKQISREKIIFYIFIGHSGMDGQDSITIDTVRHPRVWMYDTTRNIFWNACDPVDGIGTPRKSSPIIPFLKKMAMLYPDYFFCGIKYCKRGAPFRTYMFPQSPAYLSLLSYIRCIQDSVTLGGVLAMYGWSEGSDQKLASSLSQDFINFLTSLRKDLNLFDLPCIFGRYEFFTDTTIMKDACLFKNKVIEQINALTIKDPLHKIALTPYTYIPKELYFDNHHYTYAGNKLWAETAAEIITKNKWNRWTKKIKPTLTLLYPYGREIVHDTSTIPILFTCDTSVIKRIHIDISNDSGLNWCRILDNSVVAPHNTLSYKIIPLPSSVSQRYTRFKIYGDLTTDADTSSDIIIIHEHPEVKINYCKQFQKPIITFPSEAEIKIFSLKGQCIAHIQPNHHQFDLQKKIYTLSKGMYIIQNKTPNNSAIYHLYSFTPKNSRWILTLPDR